MNSWSRLLGVSLRPWSGESPLSLILRGVVQVAICIFFIVLAAGMLSGSGLDGTAQELSFCANSPFPC